MSIRFLLIVIAAVAAGCSNVEYDLVQPPSLAQHIGGKTATVRRGPLEYGLTSDEDHLVVQVFNRSAQPIALVGGESRIVDPDGQSHPISAQVIASQSSIKFILPPLRPLPAPAEPEGFSRGYFGPEFPYDNDPFWDGPPYHSHPFFDSPPLPPPDDQEGSYWRWDHGDVRLVLVYLNEMLMPSASQASAPATRPANRPIEVPPGRFTHEFVFRQQKL